MSKLSIAGAGSWGTSLAITLAPRFENVALWARSAERAREMRDARENTAYLPGFRFPENLKISHDLAETLQACDILITAAPSQHLREVCLQMAPYLEAGTTIVSATKGVEKSTLLRMSEVIEEACGAAHLRARLGVLSGPTFAKEIAAGEPAAVVVAAHDLVLAQTLQSQLSGPTLRCYASEDVIGVEIGAATKNVIAIGAGICRGLGLGGNTVAALITRGLAELTRLAVAMGGKAQTLAGLAGLGDLVLTATGDLSRNRTVGYQLGQGKPLASVLAGMSQIAEGVETCSAVCALGRKLRVSLPICDAMYRVLFEGQAPQDSIKALMSRPLTHEA